MKISYLGLELEQGKIKYKDKNVEMLVDKFTPKKTTPYFAEFVADDFIGSDCIVVQKEKILDLLILDMDKVDTRLTNTKDEAEISILKKIQENLEREIPVCDIEFGDDEIVKVKELAPLSFKPTLIASGAIDANDLIAQALEKAEMMFFYTAGKQEVHAWLVKKDSDVVSCAGKIHSDLARGFIKAEIVNVEDFSGVHNMQEARSNGIVSLVDRDYIVKAGDILDIRFNV